MRVDPTPHNPAAVAWMIGTFLLTTSICIRLFARTVGEAHMAALREQPRADLVGPLLDPVTLALIAAVAVTASALLAWPPGHVGRGRRGGRP